MINGGVLVMSVFSMIGAFISLQHHNANEKERKSQWDSGHADEYKVVSGSLNDTSNEGKTVFVQDIPSISYQNQDNELGVSWGQNIAILKRNVLILQTVETKRDI